MKTRYILTVLFLTFFLTNISAFKLQPISMDFKDEGKESVKFFTAKNTDSDKIALKVEIYIRDMDVNGKDILTKTEEDFFIYPKQFILKGNSEQRIRVQYQGGKTDTIEKSYRIIVDQVPIEFDNNTNKGGLNILYRYIGSIYILPEKITQNVTIISSKKTDSKLLLNLENSGNSHVILQDLHITLSDKSNSIVLKPEDLIGLNGTNILTGKIREFITDWPDSITESDFIATIEYEAAR